MVFNWFRGKKKENPPENAADSAQGGIAAQEALTEAVVENAPEVLAEIPPQAEAEAALTETVTEAAPELARAEVLTEIPPQAEAEEAPAETVAEAAPEVLAEIPPQAAPETEKTGYFQRLKQGLAKTRSGFADLFLGKKTLDKDLIDDLEMQLLTADVGIEVTDKIIREVTQKMERKELNDVRAVRDAVKNHMQSLLEPYAQAFDPRAHKPFVLLMTGINGAGKTTTIGKLSRHFQQQGLKVMLAAGDTFRAAAVEQLQSWGERHNIPVIAQKTGADAASVAYDALESARARQADVLIIDTAGRLHTQDHLMEELKKIKRVLKKIDPASPHETLLVIDAGNGQNALRQAEQFHQAMELNGIILTKLDGTAKGGIVFAVTERLGLPVRYIGVGEQPGDLRPFNAKDFVNALLYGE